ncbi:MAG: exodeoxyribonuclease VII large subunit [Bacteroidota bacterium]
MTGPYSLSSLLSEIRQAVGRQFPTPVWVVAEISDIRYNMSGHCYLELIDKDPEKDHVTARIRANIWSYALRMIKPFFETTTGQELSAGIKVLVNAGVEFHEVYGFSLSIINIDPNYTIGDMARKKHEIIKQLKEDGVFSMNSDIEFPSVIQNIAVISSDTAAGYGDFASQLTDNPFGYKYLIRLFPAYMQGEKTEGSIISALEKIFRFADYFDAVVIIRGGGAKTDLHWFDSYSLATNIAQFPLPVLTGIGHDRDETITDMVACMQFKTPTAVADFLINHMHAYESEMFDIFSEIGELTFHRIRDGYDELIRYTQKLEKNVSIGISLRKNFLIHSAFHIKSGIRKQMESGYRMHDRFCTELRQASKLFCEKKGNSLEINHLKIQSWSGKRIAEEHFRLDRLNNNIHYCNPDNLLKK